VFVYRALSLSLSQAFFLAVTPALRYGENKQYTLMHEMTGEQYRNGMLFAMANLLFVIVATMAACVVVRWKLPATYIQVQKEFREKIQSAAWLGSALAILTSGSLLAVSITVVHMKIWYAWTDDMHTLQT